MDRDDRKNAVWLSSWGKGLPSEVDLATLWDIRVNFGLILEIWLTRLAFIPSGYHTQILLLKMHTLGKTG